MDGVTKECEGTTEVPYGFIFYDTEAAAILEMFTELEAINTKAVFLINTPYRLPGEIPTIKKLSQQHCSRPSRALLVNHST